jgi:predicted ATPase
LRRNLSVLSQLEVFDTREEIAVGIKTVLKSLRNIFILDPNPSAMRAYSRPSERLKSDGSNIAGVLAALPFPIKDEVQTKLTSLTRSIPEKDITRVWAETVDRHGVDAMLYCEEQWGTETTREVDARGLSDGTLRYIAIMTTLLTQSEGSLVVIEEIDNGLHPSRAELLLTSLKSIGHERKIDIIVTTHNVALLDALAPETIPAVTVAYRNEGDGSSELELMNDIPALARLLAEGPLGRLSAEGKVEQAVRRRAAVG